MGIIASTDAYNDSYNDYLSLTSVSPNPTDCWVFLYLKFIIGPSIDTLCIDVEFALSQMLLVFCREYSISSSIE